MPQRTDDRRKKKVLAAVLALVAVLVLLLGGWFAWRQTSPPLPEDLADIEDLLDDGRYQRMSNAEQRPYQERINELWGGMSPEDRERLGELIQDNPDAQQAAMDAMVQGMRDMYANAVRSGNMGPLNAMADQMGNRMAEGGGDRPEMTEEELEEARDRMNNFLDSGDPQAMGFMSEMFKGMMERRRERGLGGF